MAGKQHLEPEGFNLYRKNKDQKEIAEILGVSEQTISTWKKKFDWESRKRKWLTSRQSISERVLEQTADMAENMNLKENPGILDLINKATLTIERLDKSVDMLASTIQVMEDFIKYLHEHNPELGEGVQEALADFLVHQGNKYEKS